MSDPRDLPPAVPTPAESAPPRLALRLDELARSLGVARRTLERARAAGRFPAADVTIGRVPLWQPATIRRWMEGGGA